MLNLKQLFCSHKFNLKGRIDCTFKNNNGTIRDVPVFLYECCKCRKRIVVRETTFCYRDSVLALLELWEKHKIEIADIDADE